MSINFISALVAIVAMLLVARGFLPLVSTSKRDFLANMTIATALLSLSTIVRMIYWDFFMFSVASHNETWWNMWFDLTGGTTVNIIPNALIITAAFFFLRARYLLIPEEDRRDGRWNIFTAAFYPARRCIAVRVAAWRAGK